MNLDPNTVALISVVSAFFGAYTEYHFEWFSKLNDVLARHLFKH